MKELRDRINRVAIRAAAAQAGVRSIEQGVQAQGLGLRGDIKAASIRLDYVLQEARASLQNGDVEGARNNLQYAEGTLAEDREVSGPIARARRLCLYNFDMPSSMETLATPELIAKYEAVIGLEVHVQLATRTKIFCGCATSFGAAPNSNVCPVCLGLPGALPVLNRHAVELAIEASLALNCTVNPKSIFARKNYFYPDLPKGYQISQYDQPLAEHGFVDVIADGAAAKRIGVTRVHMEDDAGKSIHDGFKDSDRYTYVDLNRSGTPLIEIVSEPDMRSSAEAYAYLTEIKQVMQYLNVSTCDMEKGHLRCDANVSVRLRGAEKLGTKAEVKNLNSFKFLRLALDHEIARQVALIESGGRVVQETRLYNPGHR